MLQSVCFDRTGKGGTIYMGLTKQGCVRGIRLTRDDRDSMRLGVDAVMTRCAPCIPHTQLHVRYVRVRHRAAAPNLEPLTDCFVAGQ